MISVILPTIRPALVGAVLASVPAAANGLPVEVIVVADFESTGHRPWIVRERGGVMDAIKAGYDAATGEWITVTNDETLYAPGCLERLWLEACAHPDAIVGPVHFPFFRFEYYGRRFEPYPFARRDVFERLGGMFDTAYRGFYADPDLSMRAYAAGVSLITVTDACIHHANTGRDDSRAAAARWRADDQRLFRSRWDHLGDFRDP